MARFENVLSTSEWSRLRDAVEWSRRRFRPFVEVYEENVKLFCGHRYGTDPQENRQDHTPVNLLELAHNTYARHLVAYDPQVLVNTRYRSLKPFAADLEARLNYRVRRMRLARTLQACVANALFGMAVAKVGVNRDSKSVVPERFVEAIPMHDIVLDMAADSFETCQFVGHVYRIPYKHALELFDRNVVKRIGPTEHAQNEERADGVAAMHKGSSSDVREFMDTLEVLELYLPLQNAVVTIPSDLDVRSVLDSFVWEGPEHGPYRMLSFIDVPRNPVPLAPDNFLTELHLAANKMWNKVIAQGERSKTSIGYRSGAEGDAERLKQVPDGGFFKRDGAADSVVPVTIPGPDGATMTLAIALKQTFKEIAGNIDALAGLSPQADTLGAEQIIQGNVAKRVADMQSRVEVFTRGIIQDLAWYECRDASPQVGIFKRIDGTDIEVPVGEHIKELHGRFLLYNFDFAPYSMQHKSPGQELAIVMQTLSMLAPYIPQMQAKGITLSEEVLLSMISQLTNTPRLLDLFTFTGPPAAYEPPPSDESVRQSPQTVRTNVRINRPGSTVRGQEEQMMAQLMGVNRQPATRQQVGRMVG